MVLPKRIHHPGFIYHVINRGNNRQAVFLEDEDYSRYLGVLYRYKRKLNFKIFAYCLMTNHIHLLIQVSEKASISKIMQAVTICHTRHYHYKYRQCGHLWQGRFRSPIVSGDAYLMKAMMYIEQNPVRAKMVMRMGDYRWSSYKLNMRRKESKFIDRKDNPLYIKLGGDEKRWVLEYQRKMQEVLNKKQLGEIRKSTRGIGNYMSEKFKKVMKDLIPKKRRPGRPRKSYDISDCEV